MAALPNEDVDGWVSKKSEKRVLGKATWERYWTVVSPELFSMRFYADPQGFFCGEELGEISLQRLKLVIHHVDKKGGTRFGITDHSGREFEFQTETAPEASGWVAVLKKFQKAPMPRFSISMGVGFGELDKPLAEGEEDPALSAAAAASAAHENPPIAEDEELPEPVAVVEAPLPQPSGQPTTIERDESSAVITETATRDRKFTDALEPLTKIKKTDEDDKPATDPQGRKFLDALAPLTKKKKKKDKEVETVKEDEPHEDGEEKKDGDDDEADKKKKKKKEKVTKSSGSFTVRLRGEDVKINASIEKARTTTFVTWDFELSSEPFKIELEHGRVFGKRVIALNGKIVHTSRLLLDDGSRHVVELNPSLKMAVVIASKGFTGFSYLLQFIPISEARRKKEEAERKAKEEAENAKKADAPKDEPEPEAEQPEAEKNDDGDAAPAAADAENENEEAN